MRLMLIVICQSIRHGIWACRTALQSGASRSTARSCQVVDYYEASGHGAEHYCEWLNEQKVSRRRLGAA